MAMSTCFITIFSSSAVVSAKTDMCSFLRYRQFKDKTLRSLLKRKYITVGGKKTTTKNNTKTQTKKPTTKKTDCFLH